MIATTAEQIRATGTLNQGFLAARTLTSDEIAFLARAERVRNATTSPDIIDGACPYVAAAVFVHPQSTAQHVAIWQYEIGREPFGGFDGLRLLRGDEMPAAIAAIEARHAEIVQIEATQGFSTATDGRAVDDKFLRAAVAAARRGRSIRRNEVF